MDKKIAIGFGATGQDFSYLAEFLLSKDYYVVGVKRRSSIYNLKNLVSAGILYNPNFILVEGDITDPQSVSSLISKYKPDECYNLAAQSHVGTSFEQPSSTFLVNATGVLYILEAIRNYSPTTRFYQASTSELFGNHYSKEDGENYQDEDTPFSPNSPYAIAKLAAHEAVRVYRDSYSIYASAGILFNHESERRGENFVTRKITKYIGKVINYDKDKDYPKSLQLGNIEAYRDWGHAEDYVKAMWLMLQQDKPDDYVVATGKTHSVKEFLQEAFSYVGLHWEDYVVYNAVEHRPNEVPYLCGRAYKAKRVLGWEPTVDFTTLVHRMVDHDINEQKKNIHS